MVSRVDEGFLDHGTRTRLLDLAQRIDYHRVRPYDPTVLAVLGTLSHAASAALRQIRPWSLDIDGLISDVERFLVVVEGSSRGD